MSEQFILPSNSKQYTEGSATLTQTEFPDGAKISEIDFHDGSAPIRVVSDVESGIVPAPDKGRYPYTERVAALVLDHFDQTGEFPAWAPRPKE